MTSKQKRISSKISRNMLSWKHYQFKQILSDKMTRSGGRVIDCSEYYTSKTCTHCGMINHKLKSEKVFACPSCSLVINRDTNGARNIYLKNMNLLSLHLRM